MPYKNREDLYKAQKKHRIRVRAQLFHFLQNKFCIDCGEEDPIVLEFDHRDPEQKVRQISRFLSGHHSWESILKEIEKCDIRCANCHRRKTYKQFNSFGRSMPL
jgi:hypothetical protein